MALFSPLELLGEKVPPVARRVTALALLLAAGYLDYLTGPDVAAAPFYIPILLVLACFESWQVSVAYAGVAAAIYLGADLLSDPRGITLVFPYWRALARLVSFGLIAATTSFLIADRRKLQRSEQALRLKAEELAAKNQTLNRTLQELQRLHLELTVQEKRVVVMEALSEVTYSMERPLASLEVYAEELSRLIGRLQPTEETVLVLDEIRPLLEKLQERLGEMEVILQEIRSLRKAESGGGRPAPGGAEG